jgi:hypothetical protein
MVLLICTETHKGDGINNQNNRNWFTSKTSLDLVLQGDVTTVLHPLHVEKHQKPFYHIMCKGPDNNL